MAGGISKGRRGRAFLSHQGRATAGVCVGGGGGERRHGRGGRGQSDQHREAGMYAVWTRRDFTKKSGRQSDVTWQLANEKRLCWRLCIGNNLGDLSCHSALCDQ